MSLVKTTHGKLGVVSGIQANTVVFGDSICWALCLAHLFVCFLFIYIKHRIKSSPPFPQHCLQCSTFWNKTELPKELNSHVISFPKFHIKQETLDFNVNSKFQFLGPFFSISCLEIAI